MTVVRAAHDDASQGAGVVLGWGSAGVVTARAFRRWLFSRCWREFRHVHCTKERGHPGPHTWARLERLSVQIVNVSEAD